MSVRDTRTINMTINVDKFLATLDDEPLVFNAEYDEFNAIIHEFLKIVGLSDLQEKEVFKYIVLVKRGEWQQGEREKGEEHTEHTERTERARHKSLDFLFVQVTIDAAPWRPFGFLSSFFPRKAHIFYTHKQISFFE